MNPRKFPAVSTFSWQGALLVAVLRFFGYMVRPFVRLQRPLPDFEENPAYYSAKDLLYFAYKYYLHPPEKAETDTLSGYFQNMAFPFPQAPEGAKSLTLSSGGDLMPYHWMNPANARHLWDEIGSWFFDADIVFANLETPLDITQAPSSVPEVMLNHMHFNGDAALFNLFNGSGNYKGFDILSTANNHSLDMGIHGIHQTLDFLDDLEILHTGTARTRKEQQNIPLIEKNGIRVAIVAATYCLNHLDVPEDHEYVVNHSRLNLPDADLSLIQGLVKNARITADFVVLALHNGNAYQAYPSAHTVANVHRIFDTCGPDLILGSHPHNPQPLDYYPFICPYTGLKKNGLAVYSQGDFVAYDIFTWCHLHLGLKFTLSRMDDESVAITKLEAMPQYLWTGDPKQGFNFHFLPLNKMEKFEGKLSKRSKKEVMELRRFWNTHLAPQLSTMEV